MESSNAEENRSVEDPALAHLTNDDEEVQETPRRAPAEQSTRLGRPWRRIALLAVIAAILIVLIILFARWIYHLTHKTNTTKSPATSTSQKQTATSNNRSVNNPAAPSGPSSHAAAPGNSGTTNANGASLPNNGPGDTVAIFIGTSLAAAGLHYIIRVRKFNKSGA